MISSEFIKKTGYGELMNFNSSVSNVVIDSRKVTDRSMFIALPGEHTDGHKYIKNALDAGASLCVVSGKRAGEYDISGAPLWIVESPEKALQILAKSWRQQFDIPVLAITGTNGKTTTKAMCNAVLRQKYNVHTTSGNLNNQLGLPLTLLELNENHQFSILELGTNHFGEIAYLCELAQPNAGLITNIGYGHTEFFGSREGVARAKKELFDALSAKDKVFLNIDDDFIRQMKVSALPITYGFSSGNADYRGIIKDFDKNGCAKLVINDKIHIRLAVPGKIMAANALAAAAVGKTFSINTEDMIEALESFQPVDQRFTVIRRNNCTIINDAYNANPDSTAAALDTFSRMAVPGRRIFVFGDMFELGALAEKSHADIGKFVSQSPIDICYMYGPLTKITNDIIGKTGDVKTRHFLNKEELIQSLKKELLPEDTILVKGSRGNKMEEIIEGIIK